MAKPRTTPSSTRRGWASLWLVIWLPALLVLFSALLGIANLWLARVELENAMEAAALAAVKQWGGQCGGDTLGPRCVGVEFAAANRVRGQSVHISSNYDCDRGCNQNQDCCLDRGNLIFGALDDCHPHHVVFHADKCASCGDDGDDDEDEDEEEDEEEDDGKDGNDRKLAVRAQATMCVRSFGSIFLGSIADYRVQAKATAVYDCGTGRVRLVRVDEFLCSDSD
jgi:hypothetical protein